LSDKEKLKHWLQYCTW